MGRALPQVGELIAQKYRVERELGRGGMGTVLAATHVVTGRRLALKCLLPHAAAQPGGEARFLREAASVGRIQNRYVIDVFDVLSDDGLSCIVMPLVEGISYAQLLADGVPLSQALTVLERVAEGVASAHAVGIVHRDLKPANILVARGASGEYDEPRVLDFGISKLLASQDARLTASGATLGTPLYMALEQLTGAPDVDARADVFALGLILYETVTGSLPHLADSLGALAIERVTSPVPPLALLRPELPAQLADVIMRCLANERSKRPTLAELRGVLAACAGDCATVPCARPSRAAATAQFLERPGQGQTEAPSALGSAAHEGPAQASHRPPGGGRGRTPALAVASLATLLIGGAALYRKRSVARESVEPAGAANTVAAEEAQRGSALASEPREPREPRASLNDVSADAGAATSTPVDAHVPRPAAVSPRKSAIRPVAAAASQTDARADEAPSGRTAAEPAEAHRPSATDLTLDEL